MVRKSEAEIEKNRHRSGTLKVSDDVIFQYKIKIKRGGTKLKKKAVLTLGLFTLLILVSISPSQEKPKAQTKAPNPIASMTKGMTERLSSGLHVKNIVGDPVKVGKMTIIPIIMVEVGFGGGGAGAPGGQPMGGNGFYISGNAKPVGFVIVTQAGVKFVPVGKMPRK
jgi:hypothetical protein